MADNRRMLVIEESFISWGFEVYLLAFHSSPREGKTRTSFNVVLK